MDCNALWASSLVLITSTIFAGCSNSTDSTDGTQRLIVDLQPSADILSVISTANTTDDTDNEIADGVVGDLVINESNFDHIAKTTVDVLQLDQLTEDRNIAYSYLWDITNAARDVSNGEEMLPGYTLASEELGPDHFGSPENHQTYTCDEGGSVAVVLKSFNGGPFSDNYASFDNCIVNGTTHNGVLESTSGRRQDTIVTFRDYSRSDENKSLRITGEVTNAYAWLSGNESTQWIETSYSVTSDVEDLTITSLNWEQAGSNLRIPAAYGYVVTPSGGVESVARFAKTADFTASFNFKSAATNEETIAVSLDVALDDSHTLWALAGQPYSLTDLGSPLNVYETEELLAENVQTVLNTGENEAHWDSGTLRMTALDNSTLSLLPDSDRPARVILELNGSGENIDRSAADGYQIVCASVLEECAAQ